MKAMKTLMILGILFVMLFVAIDVSASTTKTTGPYKENYNHISFSENTCRIWNISTNEKDEEPTFETNSITQTYEYDEYKNHYKWDSEDTYICTKEETRVDCVRESDDGICMENGEPYTACTEGYYEGGWDFDYKETTAENVKATKDQKCGQTMQPSATTPLEKFNGLDYNGNSPGNGITRHRAKATDPGGWEDGASVNDSEWIFDYDAFWVIEAKVWFEEGEGQQWTYEKDPAAKVKSEKLYGDDEWVKDAGHHQKYYGLYSVLDDGGWGNEDKFAKFFYYYRDPYTDVTEDGRATTNYPIDDNYTTRWWTKNVGIVGSEQYKELEGSGGSASKYELIVGEHHNRYCYPYFYGDPRDSLNAVNLKKGERLAKNYVYRTKKTGNQANFQAETQTGKPPGESNDYFSDSGNTGWAGQGRLNVPYINEREDNLNQWWWDEDVSRMFPPGGVDNLMLFYPGNMMETTPRVANVNQYLAEYQGPASHWYIPNYNSIESLYKLDFQSRTNAHWTEDVYSVYMFDLAYPDNELNYRCDLDYDWFLNGYIQHLITSDSPGASPWIVPEARNLKLPEDGGTGERVMKQDEFVFDIAHATDLDLMIEGCFYVDEVDEMECYYKKDGTEIRVEETSPGAIPPELDGMYFIKGHWYNFDAEVVYDYGMGGITRLNGLPESVWYIDKWIKDIETCCEKVTNSETGSLRTNMPYTGFEHQMGVKGVHHLRFSWFDNVSSIEGITNFDIQFKTVEINSLDILNENGEKGPTTINVDEDNDHEFNVQLTFSDGIDEFQYDWTNSMNEWYYDPYTMEQVDPENRAGFFMFHKGDDYYKEWQRGGIDGDVIERKIYAVWFDDILDYVLYRNELNGPQIESTNVTDDSINPDSETNLRDIYNGPYEGSNYLSWAFDPPAWVNTMGDYAIQDSNWDILADFHTVKLTNNCQNIKRYVNKCDVPYSWQTQDPYSSSRQAKLNTNWKSYRSLSYGENFIPFNSSDASYNKNPYFIDLRFPVTGASNGVGEY